MRLLVLIIPIALLVAYSQLIVKWRTSLVNITAPGNENIFEKLIAYLSDPFIATGYIAALVGSFMWLFVISKISLSIGFPIYIGVTFLLVILGSWLILHETITVTKLIAVLMIFAGITLGVIK
jgi:multidrug transporter EmrE-like cation transporter